MKRKKRPFKSSFLSPHLAIPLKAGRVLNVILIALLLIIMRVWHLAIVQHEEKLGEARRPQKRIVIDPAKRGSIRDRFQIPLAINQIQYSCAILYSQIKQIPSIKWENENGKKIKKYARREYITALSQILGEILELNPERIEDEIHSKASLYNHIPYVIKKDLSETEYYRLKMLEKDWPGIHVQKTPKRFYPHGKVAADLIGYTGAISRNEYEKVVKEIQALETLLKETEEGETASVLAEERSLEEIQGRLDSLLELAYSIKDEVGKTGIESRFETTLRGSYGKKIFVSDAQGNFLKELPDGKSPQPGQYISLTISQELQEFAEILLIQNESIRSPRTSGLQREDKKKIAQKEPWIKGGAIVAMDPFSGDVLALASYPRFDLNDFITSGNEEEGKRKNLAIQKWFETETYIGDLWDQKYPLQRERYDIKTGQVIEEKVWIDWDTYLDKILASGSPIREALKKVAHVQNGAFLLKKFEDLFSLTSLSSAYPLINLLYQGGSHQSHGARLGTTQQTLLEKTLQENQELVSLFKQAFSPFFTALPLNYDKVFFIDLLRLVIDLEILPNELLKSFGKQTLSEYRAAQSAKTILEAELYQKIKFIFREHYFKPWRQENQREFLKKKRIEEKIAGVRYPKPYLDLLDKQEKELFEYFWNTYRLPLMTVVITGDHTLIQPEPSLTPYINTCLTWHHELDQKVTFPSSPYEILKKASKEIPLNLMPSYLASMRSFHHLSRPLLGKYRQLRGDPAKQLEKDLAMGFYPRYGYGFARSYAYRQAGIHGSLFKLVTAYEALLQKHQKNGEKSDLNPLLIEDDIYQKGKALYLGKDALGNPIPQLYKGGRIPRSHKKGLGKMDLIKALEVSSNPYFSLLAGDCLEHPDDLSHAALSFGYGKRTGIDLTAEISGRVPSDLSKNRNGLYAMAIGQHSFVVTPLQMAVMLSSIANGGQILKPRIVHLVGEKGAIPPVNLSFKKEKLPSFSYVPKEVRWEVPMPDPIRSLLIEGMHRMIKRIHFSAIWELSHLYEGYPEAISDFLDLKDQCVGKSSTAESVEFVDLDLKLGTVLYNHIGFGGIIYERESKKGEERFVFKDRLGKPELVVIVYARYGGWGKDVVPLAMQVANKWREIKRKNNFSSGF